MHYPNWKRGLLPGLLLLGGCAASTPPADEAVHLTILHTNDHHGRFWHNARDEYGMAARKTLVDDIRDEVEAAGGQSLLLSGGDINTGVPESDLLDAEPDFRGMNLLGYDAMAVGNHEFDNPLPVLRRQEDWANFPMLSANIYRASTGERLFPPYRIFDLDGLEVAVLGLTTEDTAVIGNPENLNDIEFRDPVAEAAKLVPELRERADIVIAATHMGHYADARHGANAPGDVTLARRVPGIDLIVGGHSQEPVCMAAENRMEEDFVPGDACVPDAQNGTLIVQAHEWGKYVGRADLVYRDGDLRLADYRLLPVNLLAPDDGDDATPRQLAAPRIAEDQAMLSLLAPYQQQGQQQLDVRVGRTDGRLEGDRDLVRRQPTNLGRLIATAQAEAAQADLGVVNAGGVRDSLADGPVSYRDILRVQPFANRVCYVELSGAELKAYLATLAAIPPDTGAYPQFGRVRFELKDGELHDLVLTGNGERRVEDDATYRLAINSYSASGAEGYPPLDDHAGFVDTGLTDAVALKRFIERHSPIDASAWRP
ncbi:bifunctional UDP-sugar hydrolase/5'-nucleotidase UshA [Halomonas organivorans]|uniref:5'-nucleotidase/UDP-sugar diphosphatase n=1 Tax=Halomonas organivorans TaxID=257772 RepID=A0A7W5C1K2_9GAMM|nr:bifunctional UDP-sugar hydrolase/5'-nucleotidase UshA [Halomonas organivorans]MBB3143084.1 5'-nucleotidase/UDP-sugar diphosphatase [Halomonas organivorans]